VVKNSKSNKYSTQFYKCLKNTVDYFSSNNFWSQLYGIHYKKGELYIKPVDTPTYYKMDLEKIQLTNTFWKIGSNYTKYNPSVFKIYAKKSQIEEIERKEQKVLLDSIDILRGKDELLAEEYNKLLVIYPDDKPNYTLGSKVIPETTMVTGGLMPETIKVPEHTISIYTKNKPAAGGRRSHKKRKSKRKTHRKRR
jgi:hypothetical protein